MDSIAGVDDMEKWKFLTLPGLEIVQPVGWTALPRPEMLLRVPSCSRFVTGLYLEPSGTHDKTRCVRQVENC
jgi:hypothetical protein